MTTAWELFRTNIFKTFGDALKAAWNRIKLTTQLRKGIAYFSFLKKDGSIREAIGTLNGTNFEYKTKGSHRRFNAAIVKYYDIEKRAFRSFKVENFIKFN